MRAVPASLPVPVVCGRVIRPVLFVESLTRFLQSYQPLVGLAAGPPVTKPGAVGGAQRAVRDRGRGRPAGCPCSTASRSCRPSAAAWRSRTSTDPASADGPPASGPTHAAYGTSVFGSIAMRRRVAQAHGVDLGLGLAAAALGAVEQVRAVRRRRRRQRVGRADADRRLRPVRELLDRVQAQHLAVVIVRVARRPARVTDTRSWRCRSGCWTTSVAGPGRARCGG